MSAALRRGQALRATLVLLAVALAALSVLVVGPPPAGAATAPTPSPSATWPVSVQVTSVSPAVLRPGDDLTVTARLRNDGTEEVAAPSAVLRLSRIRLHTRPDLQSWASGEMAAGTRVASDTPDGPLAPGASVEVTMTVGAQDVRLLEGADVWGPRGLTVDARAGSRVVGQQRTFLLWLPTEDVPTTTLSVAVPVTGPPAAPVVPASAAAVPPETPDGGDEGAGAPAPVVTVQPDDATVTRLDEATGPGERLTQVERLLASAPEVSAVIDPALLAQSAAAGPRARQWSAAVTGLLAGRDVLTLPWADPDVAAVAHGARPDLAAVAASTALPWVEQTFGPDVPLVLWAPGPTLPDDATAALTANAGAAAMVLPVGDLDSAADSVPAARTQVRPDGTAVAALVPDPVLTGLLTAPRSVEPGASPTTAVQRALAELAVAARQDDGPPDVLVAPGRDWVPEVPYATALLDAAAAAPWVRITPASSLLSGSTTARTSLPDTASDAAELAPGQVQVLAAARDRAHTFADVTPEPQTFLAGVDEEVLAPLSVAWRTDPTGRDALVAAAVADVDERTSGLTIAPLSDVLVVSAKSDRRLTVRNALDVPVTVQVVVSPRKSCLQVEPIDPVDVDASSERSVPVTLSAHANCDVRVVAQLTTTSGSPVSAPVEFTARVQPTIENVGTAVVGVLLAIGLVLGIVRTVRRGQSARRGARLEAESDAPTTLGVLGGAGEPTTGQVEQQPVPDGPPPEDRA